MKCPHCRLDNRPGVRFCGECGARLEAGCPACEAANPATNKFCHQCGADLAILSPAVRFRSPDSYTPKHLAERILTSRTTIEGERKQVTVLFADLKDSLELLADRDPEEARRILDPVLDHMIESVHHYEGTVNQVMGDGIMALFGAPVAHEDHAIRGCLAALRMQERIRRHAEAIQHAEGLPIRIRVGMNSGEVVVRSIRNDLHMDYSAVGQTTHLAARMEQLAAPGAILITEHTLHLVEGYVHVRPIGPVSVKGLAAAVKVFEVLGPGAVRSRFHAIANRSLSRFVGRREELGRLERILERALRSGQVVALVGEPGVGKSRLVLELARSPAAGGWRLLETGAAPYSKATPFAPVIRLLRAYLASDLQDDELTLEQRVRSKVSALALSFPEAVPALRQLLSSRVDDPPWLELDPPERRRWTLDTLQALLIEESRNQPLLLMFEDLQWIDSETQAFLDGMVEILPAARVLLVVTYRPEYEHHWAAKPAYTQLDIDPLPPETAAELLGVLVGAAPELDGLKKALIKRAEGNPFFLEESVRTLLETGVLAGERGTYRLVQAIPGIRVPATVEAVLAARVDRLSPWDKRLLQAAAVIGHDVPLALLAAVLELDEEALRQELPRLQEAGFLYMASAAPEARCAFKHALTQEVVYIALLHEQRRVLHQRAVEAMERLYAGRLGEQVERLAHHALRGEAWDRAAEYLRTAGRRALFASANAEAVEFLEQALVALDNLPQVPDTLRRAVAIRLSLRDALWALGRMDRLHAHLERAEAIAQQLEDQPTLGRIACYTCHYLWAVGDLDAALEVGERALHIATTYADSALTAEVELYRGVTLLARGDSERAVSVLQGALLEIDRSVTTPARVAKRLIAVELLVRNFLTRALADLGRFEEGILCGEEALRLAESNATAFGQVTALVGFGFLQLRRAEPRAAVPALERGLGLCRSYSINNWLPTVGALLGAAYGATGRVDEAVGLLEESVRLDGEMRITATLSLWRLHLGEAYLRAGRAGAAQAEAEGALGECRARGERGYEAWLLHLLARVAASRGPAGAEAARMNYVAAMALAEELGMRPLVARCLLGLARLGEGEGSVGSAATSAYRERAARLAADLRVPLVLLEAT